MTPGLRVKLRKLTDLKPFEDNPRQHSPAQLDMIVASIRQFGWTIPILIDEEQTILAGHARWAAAETIGMDLVPTITKEGLSPAQKRAYVIADNKLTEVSYWDNDALSRAFQAMIEDDFDPLVTGFSQGEVDFLMDGFLRGTEGLTDEDEVPEPLEDPVSQTGDVWLCGRHRVRCGDSTKAEDVAALLADDKVDMVFTDPPYGISIVQGATVGGAKPFGSEKGWVGGGARYKIPFRGKKGTVGGVNIVEPGRYEAVIGDDSVDTAVAAYQICADLGATLIFWGGNFYAHELPPSRCWIAWDKENTGNFADVELAWTNMDRAAKLFRHMWNGLMKASERGERRVHPTQKPVALAEWCFNEFGKRGDKVLDLFLGSGSALIGAEQTGRDCLGMEMAPAYVDVCVRRWQDFTGGEATLEGDGRPFDEIAAARKPKKRGKAKSKNVAA